MPCLNSLLESKHNVQHMLIGIGSNQVPDSMCALPATLPQIQSKLPYTLCVNATQQQSSACACCLPLQAIILCYSTHNQVPTSACCLALQAIKCQQVLTIWPCKHSYTRYMGQAASNQVPTGACCLAVHAILKLVCVRAMGKQSRANKCVYAIPINGQALNYQQMLVDWNRR